MHRQHQVIRKREQDVFGSSLRLDHHAFLQEGGELADRGEPHGSSLENICPADQSPYNCLAQVAHEDLHLRYFCHNAACCSIFFSLASSSRSYLPLPNLRLQQRIFEAT